MLGYNSELWQLNTETPSAVLGMSWVAPLLELRMRAASKMKVLVAQSCLTLRDPTGSPPGSSVHGILQARKQKLNAIFTFFRKNKNPLQTSFG